MKKFSFFSILTIIALSVLIPQGFDAAVIVPLSFAMTLNLDKPVYYQGDTLLISGTTDIESEMKMTVKKIAYRSNTFGESFHAIPDGSFYHDVDSKHWQVGGTGNYTLRVENKDSRDSTTMIFEYFNYHMPHPPTNDVLHQKINNVNSTFHNITNTMYDNLMLIISNMTSTITFLTDKITVLEGEEDHYKPCGTHIESHYNEIHEPDGTKIINGTNHDDWIRAIAGDYTIYAGNGDDCIFGGNGSQIIYAGNGDDIIYAGNDTDTIYGGNGRDKCFEGEIFDSCEEQTS